MRAALISVVPFLLAATPAMAADMSTLTCILDTMPAKLSKEFEADTKKLVFEDSHRINFPLEQQITAVTSECTKRHGWSPDAEFHAGVWTRMHFMARVLEARARAEGHDVDLVLRVWDAYPVEIRTRFMNKEDNAMFGIALRDAGLKGPPQGSFIVGMLVGILNMRDFHRARFAVT